MDRWPLVALQTALRSTKRVKMSAVFGIPYIKNLFHHFLIIHSPVHFSRIISCRSHQRFQSYARTSVPNHPYCCWNTFPTWRPSLARSISYFSHQAVAEVFSLTEPGLREVLLLIDCFYWWTSIYGQCTASII